MIKVSEKDLVTLFEGRNAEASVEVVTARPVASSGKPGYGDPDGPVWVVFEVDGKHYRATGYHSSYDGTEFDGQPVEVQAVTKTITVWE